MSTTFTCPEHGTFTWADEVEPYCPVHEGQVPDPDDPELQDQG